MQATVCSLVLQAPNLADLIEKAKTFVVSAQAPATLRAYRNDWNDFECWCESHQLPSLPSTPEIFGLYITDCASTRAAGTITRRLTSITKAHRAAGYNDSPATTKPFIVGETPAGIRRVLGTAPHDEDALLAEDIRRIVADCPDSMLGMRDRPSSSSALPGPFAARSRRASRVVILPGIKRASSSIRRGILDL